MRQHLFFTTLSFSPQLKSRPFAVRALSNIRRDDGTVVISPDDPSKHSASVILCHGLGDTADGWVQPALVRLIPCSSLQMKIFPIIIF